MNWKILLISFLEKFRKVSEHPLEGLTEIGLKEGMIFLDVGCTLGFYSFYASSIVGEKGLVYALDINQDLISYVTNRARRREIRNIRTILANAQETGLPPESFDMVFLHLVLHDIENKHVAIKEFSRILKVSGKLVIDEENVMHPYLVKKLTEGSGFTFSKRLRRTIQIFDKMQAIKEK